MATTYTTNARLQKPATADRNWDVVLNSNTDALDASSPIGGLATTTAETPSTTLNVRVAPGTFIAPDGTLGGFAGLGAIAVPASTTTYLWLNAAGTIIQGLAFPSTAHVRLAQIISGTNSIAQVIDQRVCYSAQGSGLGFVLKTGDTITGPLIVANPTTGASLATMNPLAASIGFFGVSPNTQAPALIPLTDSTAGTASNTIQNVGTTFAQGVLNNNFASLTAQINALTAALKRHGLMSS